MAEALGTGTWAPPAVYCTRTRGNVGVLAGGAGGVGRSPRSCRALPLPPRVNCHRHACHLPLLAALGGLEVLQIAL